MGVHVHSGTLVRVLAVPQHVTTPPRRAHPRGEASAIRIRGDHIAEPGGNRDVVGGRVRERLHRQSGPLLEREASVRHRVEHLRIAAGGRDDGDVGVVLGRGAHHGWPADVDLLDAVVDPGARRDGLLERVQVHHDELEREDAEVLQRLAVRLLAQVGEQSTVDVRVQRLHAAVQRLWEPGDVTHGSDGHARVSDRLGRRARRDDLHTGQRQAPRQLDQP
jgi:hypothetical protein